MTSTFELLEKIWCEDIAREYCSGRITTERGLQAAVYMHIRERAPEVEVFVEPKLLCTEKGTPRFRPDLIVAEGELISLICEIKFVPHWFPDYEDDIRKLLALADVGREASHQLRMDPRTGYFGENQPHTMTEQTGYAFMAVGKEKSHALKRQSIDALCQDISEKLVLMYGSTTPNKEPEFGVA